MNLRLLSSEREPYVLGVVRVALAVLLLLFTGKLWLELQHSGYFGDVFHLPLLPEAWVPTRQGYVGLLALQALGSVLALVGLGARPMLALASLAGLYGMFCDRLQYHNNRYALLLLGLWVALTPCDRSWRLIGKARPGAAPRFAAWAAGAHLSVVYLSSSLGKLLDPGWRSGLVLLGRFVAGRAVTERLAPALVPLLSAPWFAQAAAIGAITTELFLALGLWFPRTRVTALWLGVMFHIGIEVLAHVELFSYTMLVGYVLFVTPELRERRLSWNRDSGWGRFLGALCARLDVLRRFEHAQHAGQARLLVTQSREGRTFYGLAAFRELSRAFPPAFPLWLPLRLLTWRERGTTP